MIVTTRRGQLATSFFGALFAVTLVVATFVGCGSNVGDEGPEAIVAAEHRTTMAARAAGVPGGDYPDETITTRALRFYRGSVLPVGTKITFNEPKGAAPRNLVPLLKTVELPAGTTIRLSLGRDSVVLKDTLTFDATGVSAIVAQNAQVSGVEFVPGNTIRLSNAALQPDRAKRGKLNR